MPCNKRSSPLGVLIYAVGLPKAKLWLVSSVTGHFSYPRKKVEVVTNEARRSAYQYTPSGYPKQSFGSFRPLQGIFPILFLKIIILPPNGRHCFLHPILLEYTYKKSDNIHFLLNISLYKCVWV